jgi:hypothetical protein
MGLRAHFCFVFNSALCAGQAHLFAFQRADGFVTPIDKSTGFAILQRKCDTLNL